MKTFDIGKDFSQYPYGRYNTDGDQSVERLRQHFLVPLLKELKAGEKLNIILDTTRGLSSSFLDEAFCGIIRHGHFTKQELLSKMVFPCSKNSESDFYAKVIYKYIEEM